MLDNINHALESAGYTLAHNAKGRYIHGLIKLVGGIENMDFLRDEYMVQMLSNAQLRKEKAFTFKQLHQLANPKEEAHRFQSQIEFLARKGVFLRGYWLECPVCDLATWYDVKAVDEIVTCQGCRSQFQLPLTIPFAYRPNRLLVEALKSGAMSIMLTVLWMIREYDEVAWQTESVVYQDQFTTDIDIAAHLDGKIVLVECKDNFKTTPHHIGELKQQLANGIKIAQNIGADRYLFATLFPKELPRDIHQFFESNHADIPIDVLTRQDLLRS